MKGNIYVVGRGLASHLRLKPDELLIPGAVALGRQGPGISSEIETTQRRTGWGAAKKSAGAWHLI